jgi:putative FmdB family regulatory protein
MPTYEYACKFCGHHLETFQSIKAEPLKKCPSCHKNGLQRLISGGAGLIFKGTGFYETDYKRSPASSSSTEKKTSSDKPKSEPAKSPAAKT